MLEPRPIAVFLAMMLVTRPTWAQPAQVESEASVETVGGEAMLLPGSAPTECDLPPQDGEKEAEHLLRVAGCVQDKEPVLALAIAKMAVRSAERVGDAVRLGDAKAKEAAIRQATATIRVEAAGDALESRATLNGAPLDLMRHNEVTVAPGGMRLRASHASSAAQLEQGETLVYTERSRAAALRADGQNARALPQGPAAPARIPGISLSVYFATNRALEQVSPTPKFGVRVAQDAFGIQQVQLPKKSQGLVAKLADAVGSFFTEEVAGVGSATLLERPQFVERLCSDWRDGAPHSLLLFVHGYNNRFEGAAMTAAELATRLAFLGRVLIYSWPSAGDLAGYWDDEDAERESEASFANLLRVLKSDCAGVTVHIVAHSMGNRLLLAGLEQVAADAPGQQSRFLEVVSAAPDVDRKEYARRIENARKAARRMTLYASNSDTPLFLSSVIHRGKRAGQCGTDFILTAAGLDSVDASAAGGNHWFYLEELAIRDFRLLLQGRATARPPRPVRESAFSGMPYWLLAE